VFAEPHGRARGSYTSMRVRRSVAIFGTSVALAACAADSEREPPLLVGSAGKTSVAGQAGSAGRSSASGGQSAGSAGSAVSGGTGGSGGRSGASAGAGGKSNVAGGGGAGGAGRSGAAGKAGTGGGDAGEAGSGDAGETGQAGSGGETEEIPSGYVKAVIGVGYGGIRIVSRDGGLSWGDRVYAAPNGGDDDDLLRAVVYGKGRWIATGWKLMTSDDGLEWEDHGKFNQGIIDDEQIIEGLAYKDGYFYAGGDGNPSRIYRSADGVEWSHFGEIGDTVKHTGLTYRGGLFVSYGDSKTSYSSSDGLNWTDMNLDEATYCEGTWKTLDDCRGAWWSDDGFYVLPEWGGHIRRAAGSGSFQNVYTDDQENTFYRSRAVAEGYVAPD
jgi:hypothetical protein